jgi:hypothetical protein
MRSYFRRIDALNNTMIHRSEQFASLLRLAQVTPQPRHAQRLRASSNDFICR